MSALAVASGATRAAGLGGAGAALVGDAGDLFANPAAIATIHHVAFEGSYAAHYLGRPSLASAALALRLGRFDWGAGVATLGSSRDSGDVLGVSSLVFRAGLVALGGSAKYARQTTGGLTSAAWAGDIGLALAVFDLMAFGVSVQNLGGGAGGAGTVYLPRRTRAGFVMNYVDPQGTYRLLTTVEGQWPDSGSAFLVLGVEAGAVARGVGLVARAGYAGHSLATAASPFSFGGSVELGRVHLDYAYRAGGAAPSDLHRVGVRWTP